MRKYTTLPPPLDVEELVPELNAHKRVCVRLHPRRATALPQGPSKVGGVFMHNDPAHWPYCAVHKTHHIAGIQLRRADVAELPFPPKTATLQVTWCPFDHEDKYCPDVKLRWLAEQTEIKSLPQNPPHAQPEFDYLPNECAVHPERVLEYIHRWALPEEISRKLEAAKELKELAKKSLPDSVDNPLGVYQVLLCSAPGMKLLGHPHWIQDPEFPVCECGEPMEYYLSIASWEWDGAMYRRWKPREDPQPDSSSGADPTGLIFGDAGDVYVFVCRNHPEWKTARVMQCS